MTMFWTCLTAVHMSNSQKVWKDVLHEISKVKLWTQGRFQVLILKKHYVPLCDFYNSYKALGKGKERRKKNPSPPHPPPQFLTGMKNVCVMISVGLAGWLSVRISIWQKLYCCNILDIIMYMISVKLSMMVVLIELFPFIPRSVTLTVFQHHSSVKQFLIFAHVQGNNLTYFLVWKKREEKIRLFLWHK